jgi:hypothetical protein
MVKESTKWKKVGGRKISPVYEHISQIRALVSSRKREQVAKPNIHNVNEDKSSENALRRLLFFSKRVNANKKRLANIIKKDKKLKNTIFTSL